MDAKWSSNYWKVNEIALPSGRAYKENEMVIIWALMIGIGIGGILSGLGIVTTTIPGFVLLLCISMAIWGIIGRIEHTISKKIDELEKRLKGN
jgi:hypothetical protein